MSVTTTTVFENVQSPYRQVPVELSSRFPIELPGEEPKVFRQIERETMAQAAGGVGKEVRRKEVPPKVGEKNPLRLSRMVEARGMKDGKGLEVRPLIIRLENRNGKHRGSEESDVESVYDPEPEFEDGFPVAVYSELISGLRLEVQRNLQAGEYEKAEQGHHRAMDYLVDREEKLGVPFDNRTEMNEILAGIYTRQRQLDKAKQILNRLLMQENGESEMKWRLYHALAEIYRDQDRLPEAEKFAKRAYIGREKSLAKGDRLLLESVDLLVAIYERGNKMETAGALRRVYHAEDVPPEPPPKSRQRDTVIEPQQGERSPLRSPIQWRPDFWIDSSSINAPTKSGETPLISAISAGDDELVRLILHRGADVEARCADQITPLMHAVICERHAIVDLLLESGAQVDTMIIGWTVLHRAAAMNDTTIVTLLLAKGANIEARSPKDFIPDRNPLARIGSSDVVEYEKIEAYDADKGWTALSRAAASGDEAMVRLLVEHGADVESRNPSNGTPLICAAEGRHEAIVDFLLMNGADIHAEDDFGWKPLHRALVNRGGERIAQMLVTHGADANARCLYKKTPLHYAIEKGDDSMVSFLLKVGADYEARDIAERTPLHIAIESRLEIMVRILLDAGADTDAMDKGGRDALAAAHHAQRRSPEIISLLAKQKREAKRDSIGCGAQTRHNSVSGSSVSRHSSSGSWWPIRSKARNR